MPGLEYLTLGWWGECSSAVPLSFIDLKNTLVSKLIFLLRALKPAITQLLMVPQHSGLWYSTNDTQHKCTALWHSTEWHLHNGTRNNSKKLALCIIVLCNFANCWYANCHHTECHYVPVWYRQYAGRRYAECRNDDVVAPT
jgi:hypothetical protein